MCKKCPNTVIDEVNDDVHCAAQHHSRVLLLPPLAWAGSLACLSVRACVRACLRFLPPLSSFPHPASPPTTTAQGISVISDKELVNGEWPVEEGEEETTVVAKDEDDEEEYEDEGEGNFASFNR